MVKPYWALCNFLVYFVVLRSLSVRILRVESLRPGLARWAHGCHHQIIVLECVKRVCSATTYNIRDIVFMVWYCVALRQEFLKSIRSRTLQGVQCKKCRVVRQHHWKRCCFVNSTVTRRTIASRTCPPCVLSAVMKWKCQPEVLNPFT